MFENMPTYEALTIIVPECYNKKIKIVGLDTDSIDYLYNIISDNTEIDKDNGMLEFQNIQDALETMVVFYDYERDKYVKNLYFEEGYYIINVK